MSAKLKICTFNLRNPCKSDGVNYFPERTKGIENFIKSEAPDIIGFQEAADMSRIWLKETLSDYTVVGCGRSADYSGESTVVAFNSKAFELIFAETFWLSTAPSVPGSRYGADQSQCPRVATAVVLKHQDAEKPFLFINTHLDHLGSAARMYGVIQILQYIDKMNMPFVLTGDMNALPDSPEMQAVINCEYRKITDLTSLLGGTFHNYGNIDSKPKIDYIFSDMPSNINESYVFVDKPKNGVYLSDHYPVIGFVQAE